MDGYKYDTSIFPSHLLAILSWTFCWAIFLSRIIFEEMRKERFCVRLWTSTNPHLLNLSKVIPPLCFALLCDSIPMSGKIYLGQHLVLIASFIKQILSFAQPNSLLSQIKFSLQMNMMRVKYFSLFWFLLSSAWILSC